MESPRDTSYQLQHTHSLLVKPTSSNNSLSSLHTLHCPISQCVPAASVSAHGSGQLEIGRENGICIYHTHLWAQWLHHVMLLDTTFQLLCGSPFCSLQYIMLVSLAAPQYWPVCIVFSEELFSHLVHPWTYLFRILNYSCWHRKWMNTQNPTMFTSIGTLVPRLSHPLLCR